MDKDTLRKEIKNNVNKLDATYIEESNKSIFEKLISLPEFILAKRVLTYLSIGREVDTLKLIDYCLSIGKTVAIPYNYRENGIMSFAALDRKIEALDRGAFGIPTLPDECDEIIPESDDLIVVPALCYDQKAYRLGRGGGYYDRYLSTYGMASIGLCREALLQDSLPTDEYDMRVDCLITEKRIARP